MNNYFSLTIEDRGKYYKQQKDALDYRHKPLKKTCGINLIRVLKSFFPCLKTRKDNIFNTINVLKRSFLPVSAKFKKISKTIVIVLLIFRCFVLYSHVKSGNC